jgi:hypothetical protein
MVLIGSLTEFGFGRFASLDKKKVLAHWGLLCQKEEEEEEKKKKKACFQISEISHPFKEFLTSLYVVTFPYYNILCLTS